MKQTVKGNNKRERGDAERKKDTPEARLSENLMAGRETAKR